MVPIKAVRLLGHFFYHAQAIRGAGGASGRRVLHAIHLESSQSAGSRRPDTCIATQRNVERGHTSWFARRCLAGSQQARMSESFVHLNNRHRLSTVYDSPFANIITR
jgi:hypothetical protein